MGDESRMADERLPQSPRLDLSTLAFFATFPVNQLLGALLATVGSAVFGGVKTRTTLLAYLFWAWFVDDSAQQGGYRLLWKLGITQRLRSASFWRWAGRYFPVTLRATAPLPPEEGPYIFACHPHGILGISHMTNFGTEATGFNETFPGVPVHLLGHRAFFRIPFLREWVLAHGTSSVEKRTMIRLLGEGRSVVLAPGGAKESLECVPHTMRLFLGQRRGFAKLALQTGAALVPVLSFGENELYSTVQFEQGTLMRRLQEGLQRRMGFALPVFCGLRWCPLMPKRRPITTIVGAPVRPPPIPAGGDGGSSSEVITAEMVQAFHAKYCEALRDLYEAHKAAHGAAETTLQIV